MRTEQASRDCGELSTGLEGGEKEGSWVLGQGGAAQVEKPELGGEARQSRGELGQSQETSSSSVAEGRCEVRVEAAPAAWLRQVGSRKD